MQRGSLRNGASSLQELPPIISQTHLAVSQQPELSSVATEVQAGNKTVYVSPLLVMALYTEPVIVLQGHLPTGRKGAKQELNK